MSYTFGAGTGDDIVVNLGQTLWTYPSTQIVCGWFYPTTLTSGNTYMSAGSTATTRTRVEVDATTSELGLYVGTTITDGAWTSSGAGITVDKWWHISWLTATSAGGGQATHCFLGDAETPPKELSLTQVTSPTGNSNQTVNLTIGNRGTQTFAFQGDIGDIVMVWGGAVGQIGTLPYTTGGTLTQAEVDHIYYRWVIPIWSGAPDINNVVNGNGGIVHLPLSGPNPLANKLWATPITPTVNGATLNINQNPNPIDPAWLTRKKILGCM